MAQNVIIPLQQPLTHEPSPSTQSEFQPKKKPRKKSEPFLKRAGNLISDEKTHKVSGLLFMLAGIYLFFAFTSHIFTGRADQSIAFSSGWKEILGVEKPGIQAGNLLGVLGAVLGYSLIHHGFGYAAFLIAVFLFLLGYDFFSKEAGLPIGRIFSFCFFYLIWLSVSFSFMIHVLHADSGRWGDLGGIFGFRINQILFHIVGEAGAGILLLFLFLGYVVIFLNTRIPLHTIIKGIGSFFSSLGIIFYRKVADSFRRMQATDKPLQAGTQPLKNTNQQAAFSASNRISPESSSPVNHALPKESVQNAAVQEKPAVSADLAVTPEPLLKRNEEDGKENNIPSSNGKEEKKDVPERDIDLNIRETVEEDTVSESEIRSKYKAVPLDLLDPAPQETEDIDHTELEENKNKIISTLSTFGIGIESIDATVGPTVTLYEIKPKAGIKISKITSLTNDIAMSLAATGIRVIAPIPGKGTIGIEIPNRRRKIVSLRSVLSSERFVNAPMALPMALGKTISNEVFVADLAKMPHILIAGATGQGKSVGINSVILSFLYAKAPAEIKFILIDPKKVELSIFRPLEQHFLAKQPGEYHEAIFTDTGMAVKVLTSLLVEMEERYDKLSEAHVRSIAEYNEKFNKKILLPTKGHKFLPYIILVADELADLMMIEGKKVETPIARLAQLSRAVGIHLVLATQRPSVDVITGVIKANFPARIAYKVVSKFDSRTILDEIGADQLVGNGDMLLLQGGDIIRLQGTYVSSEEVMRVTEYISEQTGFSKPYELPEVRSEEEVEEQGEFDSGERDPLFEEAARLIVTHQQGSVSLIQRRLKLGYNRAGRIIDQLEKAGIVGSFEGSKAREVLISDMYNLEQHLNGLNHEDQKP